MTTLDECDRLSAPVSVQYWHKLDIGLVSSGPLWKVAAELLSESYIEVIALIYFATHKVDSFIR